jgi:hypothetical protein
MLLNRRNFTKIKHTSLVMLTLRKHLRLAIEQTGKGRIIL